MGIEIVPGNKWSPKQCLGTYGYRKDDQTHMGFERVLVTYVHWKGARTHMGTGMFPRHI